MRWKADAAVVSSSSREAEEGSGYTIRAWIMRERTVKMYRMRSREPGERGCVCV